MYRSKRVVAVFAALTTLVFSMSVSAQLRLLRQSQWSSVTQTVGVTDITISYSRPGVKGRTIFGEAPKDAYAKGEATLDDQYKRPEGMAIVPFGHVWRSGANEATQFVVTDDVTINGQKLAAGKYSLHTVPGKDEWTVVFNGEANQWGSFNYDPAKDTLRVKAKPEWLKDNQEWLEYSFDPVTDNSAVVNIRWEKVRVPFTVEVDVPKVALIRARDAVKAAKADDWRTPLNAAQYAKQNKADADASAWLAKSLAAADESIKAKETFGNLAGKTNILFLMGRKDEAFATADKAIERGKADKADTAAFEKRIADIKAGKM